MSGGAANRRMIWFAALAAGLTAAADCSKPPKPKPIKGPTEQPTSKAPASASQPAAPAVQASRPAASRPAQTQPASSYDSKPPYPVKLRLRRPEDKQPGWLRIMEFVDDDQPAVADGTFPEKNRIYVDTRNVRRIQIHIGHLPLAERRRIVLQIDEQGIQLARKKRDFVMLERTPGGVWKVVKAGK